MRVARSEGLAPLHLSYCTNIHPGESLQEVRAALLQHTARVAHEVSADAPFGVGLRLSAAAARALGDAHALEEFRALLKAHRLYVYTLNGFVYGAFHGQRVKQHVYQPDWRSESRVIYTQQLADVLASLLPDGVDGSISTVPGGFRDEVVTQDDRAQVARHVRMSAIALHRLQQRTGRVVTLALEPEPHCHMETLAEAQSFFEQHLLATHALDAVAAEAGTDRAQAERIVRTHVSVCVDVCHAAVEYEDVVGAIERLRSAGISIGKVQLSNALSIERVDQDAIEALRPFVDDVYLHQVVERTAAGLRRFKDLPEAIARFEASPQPNVQWRVHFHVPLYASPLAPLSSTEQALQQTLQRLRTQAVTSHVEVETYTWDVLPVALRQGDVNASIVRELRCALAQLQGHAT